MQATYLALIFLPHPLVFSSTFTPTVPSVLAPLTLSLSLSFDTNSLHVCLFPHQFPLILTTSSSPFPFWISVHLHAILSSHIMHLLYIYRWTMRKSQGLRWGKVQGPHPVSHGPLYQVKGATQGQGKCLWVPLLSYWVTDCPVLPASLSLWCSLPRL